MTKTMKHAAAMIALLGLTALGGCQGLSYLVYLFAPEAPKTKVKAEYDGLEGRSVAIVIYADQKVQYEYPYCRLGLSSAIASEIKTRLKKVTVVDSRRVIKYQDENMHWDAMDKTKLAEAFGADTLLYITLDRYTMREPGSEGLYRGQISAAAKVYDASLPEDTARVWSAENITVVNPPGGPVGDVGEDDSKIRIQTDKIFAELLVQKFYKHEVENKE